MLILPFSENLKFPGFEMTLNGKKVSVIGSGSWATALVKVLEHSCDKIHWWIREPEIIDHIQKYGHNPQYLSVIQLNNSKLILSNDINEVIKQSEHVLICIPAAFTAEALSHANSDLLATRKFISAVKGVLPKYNMVISDFLIKELNIKEENIALISGPSHAEEVAAEKLTYLTCACSDKSFAELTASYISGRYIKTILSDDVIGIEYAAILKNIMALAAGIGVGLGFGDNFQAVLISNALREMRAFLKVVGANHGDIFNSAYAGDLFVTAYSNFSRNRVFGQMIGRGYSVKAAQLEMNMIAEGYFAVKGMHEIKKQYQIEMPIVEAVYNILYEGFSPIIEFKILSEKLT